MLPQSGMLKQKTVVVERHDLQFLGIHFYAETKIQTRPSVLKCLLGFRHAPRQ